MTQRITPLIYDMDLKYTLYTGHSEIPFMMHTKKMFTWAFVILTLYNRRKQINYLFIYLLIYLYTSIYRKIQLQGD